MNNTNLRQQILPFLADAHARHSRHALNEQAVPSYLHPMFVMRETFWARITAAYKQAPSGERVLDFGSGLGAMTPWHLHGYKQVHLFDSSPLVITELSALKLRPDFSTLHIETQETLAALPDHYFDTIFALDVLEHVEDLPVIAKQLKRLLKPDGKLVVSSPTENWVYRTSRILGGDQYNGEFHVRAAKEVEADLAQEFKVQLKKRIFPVLTYFRIIVAKPK